jgi:hypothetical protein
MANTTPFSPAVVHALQKASNSDDYALYQTYSELVQSRKSEIRDWLTMRPLGAPIAIDDVEPIEAIVPRFLDSRHVTRIY